MAVELNIVYELHPNGRIMEYHSAELDDDGNIIDEDKKSFIAIPAPSILHQPKWDGEQWVEDETQEERDIREEQQLMDSLVPSQDDLIDADLEIKTITLLMDMGVI